MKPLRNLIFHQYSLSVEFFRGAHSVHSRWNPWEDWSYIDIFWVWNSSKVHTLYIFDGTLRNLVFHRYFLNVEFFRGPHILHSPWNSMGVWSFFDIFKVWNFPEVYTWYISKKFWKVWSFIDIFYVWNFSEVHTQYIFDETFEKFGISSMFSECGLFQKFTLSIFRWIFWEVWSFIDFF